jgi:hypothetical protein
MALTKPTKTQLPQSKLRKVIGFSKNAIRLVAFGFLAFYEIQTAAALLIVAEIISIAEQST